jgi:protein-disulfide isomerase
MKKIYISLIALFLFTCFSIFSTPYFIKRSLEQNPDLIIDALKKRPSERIESFQEAVEKFKESEMKKASQQAQKEQEEQLLKSKKSIVRPTDIVRGNINSPIQIIEYSNFTCYHCKKVFKESLEPLIKNNSISFIYRHFPSGQGLLLSQYYEALRIENKEWATSFHDAMLYSKEIDQFLKTINKTMDYLNNLVEKHQVEIKKKIEEDIALAHQNNVEGTPVCFINGVKIEGSLPKESFDNVIQKILSKQ